jgi:hypothetical protein
LIRTVTAGLAPAPVVVVHVMAVWVTAVTVQIAEPICTDTWPGLLPRLFEVPTSVNVAEEVESRAGTLQLVLVMVYNREAPVIRLGTVLVGG